MAETGDLGPKPPGVEKSSNTVRRAGVFPARHRFHITEQNLVPLLFPDKRGMPREEPHDEFGFSDGETGGFSRRARDAKAPTAPVASPPISEPTPAPSDEGTGNTESTPFTYNGVGAPGVEIPPPAETPPPSSMPEPTLKPTLAPRETPPAAPEPRRYTDVNAVDPTPLNPNNRIH